MSQPDPTRPPALPTTPGRRSEFRPLGGPSNEVALLCAVAGLVAGLLTAVAAAAAPSPGHGPGSPGDPAQGGDHLGRARSFIEAEQPSRAVFHLRRHVEAFPHDLEARGLLGETYARLGLRRAALEQLRLVIGETPEDRAALASLARMQERSGFTAEALRTVDRLRQLGAEGPELDRLEGRILFKLDRHEEARGPLDAAVAAFPEDSSLLELHGLNALELGDPVSLETALRSLGQALELAPRRASLHNSLGFALERRGEVEAAFLHYLEAEGLEGGEGRYTGNRRRLESVLERR